MAQTRFVVVAMLAAVLLAAGCGGDDTPPEPEYSQTPSVTEPATGDLVGPGTTTVRDSAQRTDQLVAGAVGEATSAAPPRLGDRFSWCADIPAIWARQAQTQAQADAAEAAHLAAMDAYDSATDELDKAEASHIAASALEHYEDLRSDLEDATSDAVKLLTPGFSGADETRGIALERARDAYRASADPIVLELLSMASSRSAPQPEPMPEAMTAIEHLDLGQAYDVIDRHRSEVEDLIEPISSAYHAMLDGRRAISTAERPSEVDVGFRQVLDAAAELKQLNGRVHAALDSASDAREGHALYEREALRADEITLDEHRDNTAFIRVADSFLYTIAEPALDQAGQFATVTRETEEDVAERARFFAVTDPDGMAAFWASLSESCRP